MQKLLVIALLAGLTACQSGPSTRSLSGQPQLTVSNNSQSVIIAAPPEAVRGALVASATRKGTAIVQDSANMVVMERVLIGENPALDSQFGPSDNGIRVIRIRVRFTGTECTTTAVQDLALVNNVRTALEQSFAMPGDANTQKSLQGLKRSAENASKCKRLL
ncbi:MAG: hypothetical protein HWE23_13530 [Rhodobacteraceae bacterium]|nr:hypothetical protein [Paracoccaceae bacterium]